MTNAPEAGGAPADRPAAGAPQSDEADEGRPADESATARAEDSAAQEVAEDLDALLDDVKRERDQYLGLAQRAKADFENYRKRAARESAESERRGRAALARELLPSIDNLERAHNAAAEQGSELARGVELVLGELQATLARAGVESYDPAGERFDPKLHEAISTAPGGASVKPGTVIETLERGYRLDGQLLRPARVVVSE